MERPADIDTQLPTQELHTIIGEWIASQTEPASQEDPASDQDQAEDSLVHQRIKAALMHQHGELAKSIDQRKEHIEALEEEAETERQQMSLEREAFDVLSQYLGLPRSDERPNILRGKALVSTAIGILATHSSSDAEPIHYKDWFKLMRGAGFEIGGKDPIATFLTTISSSERVEHHGKRSGLYSVRPSEEPQS